MSPARRSILETASRLFAERGYEMVGINEIIEKSGVAKATFYSHFRSKELLCAEWLRSAATHITAEYRALLNDPRPPIAKIREKFDSLDECAKRDNFRGCPFSITASMTNPGTEIRKVILEYKTEARAFWQELASEFRPEPDESRILGDSLFLLFSGAVTEAQNACDTWPVASAKAMAEELCLSAVPA